MQKEHTGVITGEQTSLVVSSWFFEQLQRLRKHGDANITKRFSVATVTQDQFHQRQYNSLYIEGMQVHFFIGVTTLIIPLGLKLISSNLKKRRKSRHRWLNNKSYLHGYTLFG